MSSTFLSAYLGEVVSNLSNWHKDNYDFYRFGPQPQEQIKRSWKAPIIDYLRRKGYVNSRQWSDWVMAAVRLVETHLTRFEWLYNKLADDESRHILVKVLAFRALGHRKVKLPLNTLTYWDELKRMGRLAEPSASIRPSMKTYSTAT